MAKHVPGWVVASFKKASTYEPHFSEKEYVSYVFEHEGKNYFIPGMIRQFNKDTETADIEIEEGSTIVMGRVDARRLVSVDDFPCDGRVFTLAPEVFDWDIEKLSATEDLGKYANTGAPPKMREALKIAMNAEPVGTVFRM